ILQATHGIVSGSPSFYKRAFGESAEDFERLLSRPEHFIFNRTWYEELDGKSEFTEFEAQFSSLTTSEKGELIALLSSAKPRQYSDLKKNTSSRRVKQILAFYPPLSEELETEIWTKCRAYRSKQRQAEISIPEDERVEDAELTVAA